MAAMPTAAGAYPFPVTPLAPTLSCASERIASCNHPHGVAFYDTERFLVETTSDFISEALRDGDGAIVIATASHRRAIDAVLRAAGLDVEAVVADGRYLTVDAPRLLRRIMVGGTPDVGRFAETVGAMIERVGAGGREVRLFSEMVALLWDVGDLASAVTLEDLYNDLTTVLDFVLLCAHPMLAFQDPAGADAFERICAQHATVIPCEGGAQPGDDPDEQRRVIARLQQQVGALRAERALAKVDDLALMDHAEHIGGLGTWEQAPSTGELHWSDNMFRIFGLEPQSVIPTSRLVLDATHPADRARLSAHVAASIADRAADTLEYRIVRSDKTVRYLCSTVAYATGAAEQTRIVGSVQDMTSEHRAERTAAGRAAVSNALGDWPDFDAGVEGLLAAFASAMNLCAGVLWVPRDDALTALRIWHEPSSLLSAVVVATRAWHPGRATPVVGLVWSGGTPIVSNEPASGASPDLAVALQEAAIKAAIAIPAVVDGETLAVLEFLSFERVEPCARKLRALDGIGHEVGAFLGHLRGELSAPVLTPRELEVLQLAARSVTAVDIALQMHLSPATVKRHFEDAYARLGVNDRASAVAQAMRQGLIT